jgi:hypothetical protein
VGSAVVAREAPRAVRDRATAAQPRDAVAARADAHDRRCGVLARDVEAVDGVGITSHEAIPAVGPPSTICAVHRRAQPLVPVAVRHDPT